MEHLATAVGLTDTPEDCCNSGGLKLKCANAELGSW